MQQESQVRAHLRLGASIVLCQLGGNFGVRAASGTPRDAAFVLHGPESGAARWLSPHSKMAPNRRCAQRAVFLFFVVSEGAGNGLKYMTGTELRLWRSWKEKEANHGCVCGFHS